MGLLVAIQWPLSFYEGGLMGLQKQMLRMASGSAYQRWAVLGHIHTLEGFADHHGFFYMANHRERPSMLPCLPVFLCAGLRQTDRSPSFTPKLLRTIWRFARA